MRAPLPNYPWDQMVPYLERASEHPEGVVDLSIGSPVDPVPVSVRQALAASSDAHAYPATAGTLKLRDTIAEWYWRRRNVLVDPAAVLPTIGSKELVALLPFLLGVEAGEAVVYPSLAYPSYQIGAALVSAEAVASDDPDQWPENTRLVWVNSPANPDGRVLDVGLLRTRVERARELGAIIVGDECYAEFGWQTPWDRELIPSILDARVCGSDHRGVLGMYSLSKQSNLAGYRAAFVAGDRNLVDRLLAVRKHAGMMVPAPVQQAMMVALSDDEHVARQRRVYGNRRQVLRSALVSAGYRIDASEAGLYLWACRDEDAWKSIASLARLGIVAAPGVFYGGEHSRHVRFALTASDADIDAAADRLTGRCSPG